MSRTLDTTVLKGAAKHLASEFGRPDVLSASGKIHVAGTTYVMENFHNYTFKDEFEFILAEFKGRLGPIALEEFNDLAADAFTPREDKLLKKLLEEKLAVDLEGNHIPGKIGTVQICNRVVGRRLNGRGIVKNLYWPVYAGEGDERAANSGVADELPLRAEPLPIGALNTRISNEVALLMCDACVDNLDEGAGAAVIQGRSGAQPADPDTVVSGTLLFTLVCTDPAFGAAVDDAPGGIATADTIADDVSADATATLGYCRASSTTDGSTPDDDHIDGEAGTSGADFNFNTLEIVSGSTVSMTAWTVTMPES